VIGFAVTKGKVRPFRVERGLCEGGSTAPPVDAKQCAAKLLKMSACGAVIFNIARGAADPPCTPGLVIARYLSHD